MPIITRLQTNKNNHYHSDKKCHFTFFCVTGVE